MSAFRSYKVSVPSANPGRLIQRLLPFWTAVWIACQPGGDELVQGVVHHEIHLSSGPWSIHVVEVDLPIAWKKGVRLRAVDAEPAGGLETTSSMARGALAAINGGFYVKETFRVAGLQVRDGCLLQKPQGQSAFAITGDGQPLIAVFHLEAGLISADGKSLPIAGFNQRPGADELSFYNYYSQTMYDSVRAEIGFQLQGLDGRSAINDTVATRVMQVRRRAWPLLLERMQWVVAGAKEALHAGRIAPGDTVQLFLRLEPQRRGFAAVGNIQEAIGGGPRILRDGRVAIEYEEERLSRSFAEDRHPRTAIGYSQDGRTLFLVTVDGRQPGYSVGMSLAELADFMRTRLDGFTRSRDNAYQALNLDGGGSTTMVVRQQVVNSPSDQTGERPVANALLVVTSESVAAESGTSL